MTVVESISPAKINLMLRVLGRRSDGYHLLQSCFQILPWGDDIRYTLLAEKSDEIHISGFTKLALQDNLIYQAAVKLKPFAQNTRSIKIEVDKRIPEGAGLGGGSSNAATTLVVLNNLWECQLSSQELMRIGLQLGADVPFFVGGKSALVTGVGEQIKKMDFFKGYVLLLFPEIAISTAEVFNSPDLNREQTPLSDNYLNSPDFWINDCFSVVLKNYPVVANLFHLLNKKMLIRMSGTGSTLFALFKDKNRALTAQKTAQQHCRQALIKI